MKLLSLLNWLTDEKGVIVLRITVASCLYIVRFVALRQYTQTPLDRKKGKGYQHGKGYIFSVIEEEHMFSTWSSVSLPQGREYFMCVAVTSFGSPTVESTLQFNEPGNTPRLSNARGMSCCVK